MSIPPRVIFKRVRMNDRLAESPMPSLIRLSPKGWIITDPFVKWFQHFIECIPPHAPVILFMDSHASHMTPEILSLALVNDIHLVTLPVHTTHLLQPLDVGVYRPLK
jgi:hypothetical protein